MVSMTIYIYISMTLISYEYQSALKAVEFNFFFFNRPWAQVSGLRPQVLGLRSQVSGLRSQVSGLRSQVSSHGFKTLGLRP